MSSSNDDLVSRFEDAARRRDEKHKLAVEQETWLNGVRTAGDSVELILRQWVKEQGLAGDKVALGAVRLAELALDLAKSFLAYNKALATADWGNIIDRWQSCPVVGKAGEKTAEAFEFLRVHLCIAAEPGTVAEDLGQNIAKVMPLISPAIVLDVFESVLKQWFWMQPFYERDRTPAMSDPDGAANQPSRVPVASMPKPVAEKSSPDGQDKKENPTPTKTRWSGWAIAIEHVGSWHLFRKVGGEWRQQCKLSVASGKQESLLNILLNGCGFLPKYDAIKVWNKHPSSSELQSIMRRVKTEVSKIRDLIKAAIGVRGDTTNPLPFDKNQPGWRAEFAIGTAGQNDGHRVGGENRLRFTSTDRFSQEERLDAQSGV